MASRVLVAVCACLAAAAPGIAAVTDPPTLAAGRLDPEAVGPVVDGLVTEAVWGTVTPHSTFTQQDPDEGAPATERTEVRILTRTGTATGP